MPELWNGKDLAYLQPIGWIDAIKLGQINRIEVAIETCDRINCVSPFHLVAGWMMVQHSLTGKRLGVGRKIDWLSWIEDLPNVETVDSQ